MPSPPGHGSHHFLPHEPWHTRGPLCDSTEGLRPQRLLPGTLAEAEQQDWAHPTPRPSSSLSVTRGPNPASPHGPDGPLLLEQREE